MNAGIGTYVYRDETGPTSRTGIQLAYSYHIRTRKESQKFAIGLEVRALQFAIDKNKLSPSLGNDPILAGAANKFGVDAGAGVYYTNGNLSAGAAVSQLIESKLQLADVPNSKEGGKLYRHYNVTANYRLNTGGDIYLIPNVMARFIENAPSEFDFGAKLDYQDKVWWSLNWRVHQFWSIQAGLKLVNRLRVTYSYDYYVSPISVFTDGSGAHEVGLQFDLKKK
ncbi:MAG: type IX secretion system membrane protein PorP/SprF [Ferruginibacter sp.]